MGKLLDSVRTPADLKKMNHRELARLAAELRQVILEVVSRNGGHLAPNLGVVELTLALHSVLDAPEDKIIWDVGHQCYVHKLITGRREEFASLRQYGGISGFPRRTESVYDCFGTGHSSTSVSAALGFAFARDLKGEKYRVAAVIGDGSLTGGMAFEALNQAGQSRTDMLVILNDNHMSIAPNVGAISEYLTRLRLDPTLQKAREDAEELLRRIPGVGGTINKAVQRLKDSFKHLVVPGMFFEELGFAYFGPIDGHNIPLMQSTIKDALARGGPVLIHVVTKKGKGYEPAEANPEKFHGSGPFHIATGEPVGAQNGSSFSQAFGEALVRFAEKDERIVAITAAMPDGTGLVPFMKKFPHRFFDVGIAEQHAVTLAAGLAAGGLRPVVAIYSTFLQRAYDQIIHDVALQGLPVVFAVDRAGIVGDDGATHHGAFDLSYLRSVPGMTIAAPADAGELEAMLKLALESPGPSAIRYPRGPAAPAYDGVRNPVKVGRSHVIRRGRDLAIFAAGSMVREALEAACALELDGISAGVINARYVKPLDEAVVIEEAKRTGRVLTVEENTVTGGFGSGILELLEVSGCHEVAVKRLGLPDEFVEHGSTDTLRSKYGLDAAGIAGAARGMMKLAGVGARNVSGGGK